MAQDKLSVTIRLVGDKYEVTASLVERDVLPAAIFLYENTGEASLGEYQGVCQVVDLTSRQEFTGSAIDTFGNKFVRYTSVIKIVDTKDDAELVKDWMIETVKVLKQQMLAAEAETVITVI